MPRGKRVGAVFVLLQARDLPGGWQSLKFGSFQDFKSWCAKNKASDHTQMSIDENGLVWTRLKDGRRATALLGRPVMFATGRDPIALEEA